MTISPMNTIHCLLFTVLLVHAGVAHAHGPTPQKLGERVRITVSPEKVWEAIKEFGTPATWHPMIKAADAHDGNTPGKAERVLTLATGQITEGLDEYDAARRYMGWRLQVENKEAIPVSFYTITLEVKAVEGGSDVEWLSRFYRADTGNDPPPQYSDEAAIKAMTDFARAGLENLKRRIETEK